MLEHLFAGWVAAAAGADVNLGEIVFDALNLKGIGHLAKLKDDALDNLNLPDDCGAGS